MTRREALKKTALLIGGISIAPELLARALANAPAILAQVPADLMATLAEMVDVIIPDTDTPGAKAAKVHEFIAIVVQDCFPPEARADFWTQLEGTDARCKHDHGAGFRDCTPEQRITFFTGMETFSREHPDEPVFYRMLKNLTVGGYFTSEIGATQALAFDPVPGGWIPDMLIDENTKAWTPMF